MKYTVKTAKAYLQELIKNTNRKVNGLSRENCISEHQKLIDFANEIGFFKNPTKESAKQYINFMNKLDQVLINGYHDFDSLDRYTSIHIKDLKVVKKWHNGKPVYPPKAMSPAGFSPKDGVYILSK
tara:strand:- start:1467 stop:1844 length:378 start_codon:yes stop_codon:yes gene_type:complete